MSEGKPPWADKPRPLQPSEGRVPPNDLDAEAAVLSAVFLDPSNIDRIAAVLSADHFYADKNARIFQAQLALHAAGSPVDVVTVKGWLVDHDLLTQAGGLVYIASIIDAVPAIANVDTYAKLVREKWRLRQLISVAQRISAEAFSPVEDVQEFVDRAEQAVYNIARDPEATTVSHIRPIVQETFTVLQEAALRGANITGEPTGFRQLDELIGGLHGGDLAIVAARPGMGKTALVLNILANMTSRSREQVEQDPDLSEGDEGYNSDSRYYGTGRAGLMFTLEMPRSQLALRMLCSEARVDVGLMRNARLSAAQWRSLAVAAKTLCKRPIWIDDTSNLSLLELRSKVRRVQALAANKESPQLGMVAVDYLQLMMGNPKLHSRQEQISELSRGLKMLAKDLKVPIVALSQLNRSTETRSAKEHKPQLSDLRESGAIEQDADVVIFIYRGEYYEPDDAEQAGLAEIIVAKQRNGPTGVIKMRYTKQYTRFDNLEKGEGDDSFD